MMPKGRSMKWLRDHVKPVAMDDVERRLPIPGRYVTKDCFGLFDLLYLDLEHRLHGVQVTSKNCFKKHQEKYDEMKPLIRAWCSWPDRIFEMHVWAKKKGHWVLDVYRAYCPTEWELSWERASTEIVT